MVLAIFVLVLFLHVYPIQISQAALQGGYAFVIPEKI